MVLWRSREGVNLKKIEQLELIAHARSLGTV